MAAADVSEQLAREDAGRSRAIAAAAAGAVLPLAAAVIGGAVTVDSPRNDIGALIFLSDHAPAVIISGVVAGLGTLLTLFVFQYLFDATAFRRPETPRIARIMAVFGPILYFVGHVLLQVVFAIKANGFVDSGPLTKAHADDITESGIVVVAKALAVGGGMALGFAYVIIAINAMRAGLLTRFMGYMGVIGGLLFVLPIGSGTIIQTFWLAALAYLLSGRWPSGVPKAWSDGQAHPWPTMAEQREAAATAEEKASGKQPRIAAPEPAAAQEASTGTPHPTSKKRKKKRNR
jgi:hypothetical protein